MSYYPIDSNAPAIAVTPAAKLFGNFISWIFHPLLLGLYMAAYLIFINPDFFVGVGDTGKMQVLLIFIVNSVFFPLVSVLLCKALGFVDSFFLRTQKERIVLYAIAMIFFFWNFYVFKNKPGIPMVMAQMTLGVFVSVIAAFIANIYFKISMHAIGAGGLVGLLIMLLYTSSGFIGVSLAVAIFIAGLICTARLLVSDHSVKEIVFGFAAGFISQWLAAWFL